MEALGASDAWGWLLNQIEKKSTLPQSWAWESSRGPMSPDHMQSRKEWKAIIAHEAWMEKHPADLVIADVKQPRIERQDGPGFDIEVVRQRALVAGRSRHWRTTGCVTLHQIPVHNGLKPQLPGIDRPQTPDSYCPKSQPAHRGRRGALLTRHMQTDGDRPLRELQTTLPSFPQPKHRDDGMAAALMSKVRADVNRRKQLMREKYHTQRRLVITLSGGEAAEQARLLAAVTKIQKVVRKKLNATEQIDASPQRPKEKAQEEKRGTATSPRIAVKQKKKEKDALTRDKRDRSTELPLPQIDEVWDVITRRSGGISTFMDVADIVELFHRCRIAGLNAKLARVPGLWPTFDTEPEDISSGEVAHLCIMLIEDEEEGLTEEDVRKELSNIQDECRSAPCNGIYPGDESLNFGHFKRMIAFVSELMCIHQTYILSTFMYVVNGHFEMPDLFAAFIMKELGKKQKWTNKGSTKASAESGSTKKDSASEDELKRGTSENLENPKSKKARKSATEEDLAAAKGRFEGAAVQSVQKMLDTKFNNVDFSRLVYNCGVIDPLQRQGISFARASETFTQTVMHFNKIMKERFSKRPALVKDREKWDHVLTKYHPPDPHGEHQVPFALGRTEFSVLMEALFRVMPRNLFGGVLDMCISLLLRIWERDAVKEAARNRRVVGDGMREVMDSGVSKMVSQPSPCETTRPPTSASDAATDHRPSTSMASRPSTSMASRPPTSMNSRPPTSMQDEIVEEGPTERRSSSPKDANLAEAEDRLTVEQRLNTVNSAVQEDTDRLSDEQRLSSLERYFDEQRLTSHERESRRGSHESLRMGTRQSDPWSNDGQGSVCSWDSG